VEVNPRVRFFFADAQIEEGEAMSQGHERGCQCGVCRRRREQRRSAARQLARFRDAEQPSLFGHQAMRAASAAVAEREEAKR
jgi:hypothetical protein